MSPLEREWTGLCQRASRGPAALISFPTSVSVRCLRPGGMVAVTRRTHEEWLVERERERRVATPASAVDALILGEETVLPTPMLSD